MPDPPAGRGVVAAGRVLASVKMEPPQRASRESTGNVLPSAALSLFADHENELVRCSGGYRVAVQRRAGRDIATELKPTGHAGSKTAGGPLPVLPAGVGGVVAEGRAVAAPDLVRDDDRLIAGGVTSTGYVQHDGDLRE